MASKEIVVILSEEEEQSCDDRSKARKEEERTKFIWTVEKISALIKLWSKAPLLYDNKDSLYSNKDERLKAITNIAKDLGVTFGDVLGKMYSLRTYYSKQQGMIQGSIFKGEEVYQPRWQWYESLSFLSDHMRNKPNQDVSQVSTGRTNQPSKAKEPAIVKTAPRKTATRELQEPEQEPVQKTTKKARLTANNEEEAVNTTIHVVTKDPPARTEQDNTDDMLWAEQMGRSIQKIEDAELKEWLKLEIQQMIIRTRFKKPRGSFTTEFN